MEGVICGLCRSEAKVKIVRNDPKGVVVDLECTECHQKKRALVGNISPFILNGETGLMVVPPISNSKKKTA